MDEYGADMLRWMLYTINQPGLPKKFDIKGMKDIMNRVFRMLWNSYSFFVMYANIDDWKAKKEVIISENILDKWILIELNLLTKVVDEKLAQYDIYSAAGQIEKFVDNLSNWYIRRSRKRFWKSEDDIDKEAAYQTLHRVLVDLSKLMAPFTPFIAEEIYKNLTGNESVHLADFPVCDDELVEEKASKELFDQMTKVREIISEGLQMRAQAKIKVRQPLAKVIIKSIFQIELIEIIKEELNVKDVVVNTKQVEQIVLDLEITEDLKLEGQAREIVRYIQEMRKEAGYEIDNRIKVFYVSQSEVFEKFNVLIAKETLADSIEKGKNEIAEISKSFSLDGAEIIIQLEKIK